MKGKKHTPEQIIGKLRESEAELNGGATMASVCQKLAISEPTFHRWREQYGGMKADAAKKLKELEQENQRLKRAVADLTLDKQILKEALDHLERISPSQRRQAVAHVRQVLGEKEVSERRACGVLGQSRRTQRYQAKPAGDEPALVKAMLEQVRLHPRYGYRRIWAFLKREGWRMNKKRVWRLWKKEGLKVPQNKHKKRRLGEAVNGCTRLVAAGKDCIWAMDFVFDVTANGRSLKWLCIVDEFTRECLALEVSRQFKATDVIDVLRELIAIRGVPAHLRCDNGPEFIAHAVKGWLETSKIGPLYIEPGSPWQNGYAESFNSKLRDELLAVEVFETLAQAKALATWWRLEYNHRRPHSSLDYQTPAEFAAACVPRLPLRLASLGSVPAAERTPHDSVIPLS